jgi:hypothetical protein
MVGVNWIIQYLVIIYLLMQHIRRTSICAHLLFLTGYHQNQIVVFATDIVANEVEDT